MSATRQGPSSEPAGAFQEEEFKFLDVDGANAAAGAPGSSSDTQFVVAPEDNTASARIHRFVFTGLNVLVTCSALAMAKQIVNPDNYTRSESTQEAAKQLPKWFAVQYQNRRMTSDFTRGILRDTTVLMAASATWYGVQGGMKALRGKHDAINVCTAGTLSAAMLGAVFIEPFKPSRLGVWGAIGGLAGYFGYQEQQALRKALLERQQELEQKHLHKQPDEVQQAVNSRLLKHLLQLEQQEQLDQLKKKMQQHGIVDADGKPVKAGSSSSDGDGSGSAAAGEWQGLITAAPWVQEQQEQQQQQELDQEPAGGSSRPRR